MQVGRAAVGARRQQQQQQQQPPLLHNEPEHAASAYPRTGLQERKDEEGGGGEAQGQQGNVDKQSMRDSLRRLRNVRACGLAACAAHPPCPPPSAGRAARAHTSRLPPPFPLPPPSPLCPACCRTPALNTYSPSSSGPGHWRRSRASC